MRRTAALTLTLLAVVLAPALAAQTHKRDERFADRRGDHAGGGYPYPGVAHMDRVSRLAREIHETAAHIRHQYERNNRRPDWAERRAMLGLRDLDAQAARFHARVDGYRRSPRHTVADFQRLERAFHGAARTLGAIAPRPYVDRGMDRIYGLMNEIARHYGRGRRDGHWRSGPDWDRDRFDDDDRRGSHDRDDHRRYGDDGG
jgi:hypothetical protein